VYTASGFPADIVLLFSAKESSILYIVYFAINMLLHVLAQSPFSMTSLKIAVVPKPVGVD
jgi:hypothetical protein